MTSKAPGFSQKIIWSSCAIVVVALVLFSTYNYIRISQQLEQGLQEEIGQVAAATATTMSNWMAGKLALTEATAARIAGFPDPARQVSALSLVNAGGEFRNLFLGTETGAFLIDDTSTDDLTGFDPRTRPWYQQARQAGQGMFSDPYHDAFTGMLLITVAAPLPAGVQPAGVVGGDLDLTVLANTVNAIDFKGLGQAFLVNREGRILAHPDKALNNQTLEAVYGDSPPLDARLHPARRGDAGRLLGFYPLRPVGATQWYIGVDIDRDLAYASLASFRNMAVLSTIIAAVATVLILSLLLKTLTRPLQRLRLALFDIAQGEGDLTRRLPVESQDELGQLAVAFNAFVDHIHALIEDFKGSSENLAGMVGSMSTLAEKSSAESERQRHETDLVAAAISQMSSAAHEIARHAQEAADAARDADQEGQAGTRTVKQATESITRLAGEIEAAAQVISDLEGDVTRISAMVGVIRGIAEQTNLLALNAAIEAARAGEQGRGFAVVADEVRSLASKTQDSTEDINRLIERLQSGSRRAVEAMTDSRRAGEDTVARAEEAARSLDAIAQAVSRISDMNLQIATASEQQTAVTEEITRSMTNIADATASTAQGARETSEHGQRLAEIGHSIRDKVNRFRV